jgi:hypothetical protein
MPGHLVKVHSGAEDLDVVNRVFSSDLRNNFFRTATANNNKRAFDNVMR